MLYRRNAKAQEKSCRIGLERVCHAVEPARKAVPLKARSPGERNARELVEKAEGCGS